MSTNFNNAIQSPLDIASAAIKIAVIWPEGPKPQVPEHTPELVQRPLLAAERNFPIEGNEEAAGAMYGRALEIAVKALIPNEGWSLYRRIEKLATDGVITKDLKDWAHQIRDLRNDAIHEIENLPRDQLTALRGFTIALFTYLYTFPERVRRQREETHTLDDANEPPAAP